MPGTRCQTLGIRCSWAFHGNPKLPPTRHPGQAAKPRRAGIHPCGGTMDPGAPLRFSRDDDWAPSMGSFLRNKDSPAMAPSDLIPDPRYLTPGILLHGVECRKRKRAWCPRTHHPGPAAKPRRSGTCRGSRHQNAGLASGSAGMTIPPFIGSFRRIRQIRIRYPRFMGLNARKKTINRMPRSKLTSDSWHLTSVSPLPPARGAPILPTESPDHATTGAPP